MYPIGLTTVTLKLTNNLTLLHCKVSLIPIFPPVLGKIEFIIKITLEFKSEIFIFHCKLQKLKD